MKGQSRQFGPTRREILGTSTAALAGFAALRAASAADGPKLNVSSQSWGAMPDGKMVDLFTLANGTLEVKIMTLGATIQNVRIPDRAGNVEAVLLHLDTLEDYVKGHPLFGSTVGRFANRIGNAKFTIDGTEYNLTKNSGPHIIHGGNAEAFHRVVWSAEPVRGDNFVGVKLSHTSNDGEAGFPGTVHATTTYKLTMENQLIQEYGATTDKPTHVNLTNHAYWNLLGAGKGDVLSHTLMINSDSYLATDRAKIPSGQIIPVKGTPYDFTAPQVVGSRIKDVEDQNYDHCYILNKPAGQRLALAARVTEPTTGRVMEVSTTQPGVQLYTAKGLNNRTKVEGKPIGPYHGLCLETQHYPDSPNKPAFPSTLLRPGETLSEMTIHKFATA